MKLQLANIMTQINLVGWVEPSDTHVIRFNRTWIPACSGMTNVLRLNRGRAANDIRGFFE
jgi:hypothetical protein